MNIICGKCSQAGPMNTWTLIRMTIKVGDVAGLSEIAQLKQPDKDGEHDKPFGQSILQCPICKERQVAMLHKQCPEIEKLVNAAGLASDILFKKVERTNWINLDA